MNNNEAVANFIDFILKTTKECLEDRKRNIYESSITNNNKTKEKTIRAYYGKDGSCTININISCNNNTEKEDNNSYMDKEELAKLKSLVAESLSHAGCYGNTKLDLKSFSNPFNS
jgi:hypothetical protein